MVNLFVPEETKGKCYRIIFLYCKNWDTIHFFFHIIKEDGVNKIIKLCMLRFLQTNFLAPLLVIHVYVYVCKKINSAYDALAVESVHFICWVMRCPLL